jgi:hypothetical protein
MSDAAYRSTREAAKARAEALDAELRALEKTPLTELPAYPALATDEEKKRLRDVLTGKSKTRKVISTFGLLVLVLFLRASAAGSGSGGLAVFGILLGGVLLLLSRVRGREERSLEKKLRAIIRAEDESDRKFRVESGPIQKRIDDEKAERERLERQLEEARAMAEENSANEKN